mmetsp:Transcript_49163/g.151816  ORF Transcript_49163/g.151816 Transcript_49163/m.151816 type:complete len:337 (-) Transcript_49163:18-1028(-)
MKAECKMTQMGQGRNTSSKRVREGAAKEELVRRALEAGWMSKLKKTGTPLGEKRADHTHGGVHHVRRPYSATGTRRGSAERGVFPFSTSSTTSATTTSDGVAARSVAPSAKPPRCHATPSSLPCSSAFRCAASLGAAYSTRSVGRSPDRSASSRRAAPARSFAPAIAAAAALAVKAPAGSGSPRSRATTSARMRAIGSRCTLDGSYPPAPRSKALLMTRRKSAASASAVSGTRTTSEIAAVRVAISSWRAHAARIAFCVSAISRRTLQTSQFLHGPGFDGTNGARTRFGFAAAASGADAGAARQLSASRARLARCAGCAFGGIDSTGLRGAGGRYQ